MIKVQESIFENPGCPDTKHEHKWYKMLTTAPLNEYKIISVINIIIYIYI